jgi:hypothetical protein
MSQKEFSKLRETWYKKLARAGFKDAEQLDGNLKVWHKSYFNVNYGKTKFLAKQEYYIMAEHFLNSYFNDEKNIWTPIEREIWKLHSEGVPYRDILKIVAPEATFWHVCRTIQTLAQEMLKGNQEEVDYAK